MSTPGPKWCINLALARDGRVLLTGEVDGELSPELVRVERVPSRVLQTAEHWLETFENGTIELSIRSGDTVLQSWRTRSGSLALYWIASVLGKVWHPNFGIVERAQPAWVVLQVQAPSRKRANVSDRESSAPDTALSA